MKTRFLYFVICLILVNCKEPQPQLTFKHSDKTIVLNCDNNHSELFNEAIHHFEANLTKHFNNKNPNLSAAYRQFLIESTSNRTNYNNISNQHSLDIFIALKNVDGLWIQKNNKLSLNYKHDIFNCIGENIKDNDLKSTYNALLTTNSMSMRMLKDVLIAKSNRFDTDKHLATFVALELYYSKLSNVDLSLKQEAPVDIKLKEEKGLHAGHNHD